MWDKDFKKSDISFGQALLPNELRLVSDLWTNEQNINKINPHKDLICKALDITDGI